MSSANISGSFSPEDWALVRSSPLLAGLLITLSDLRTGPIGVLKEGFAPSQAIIEAGEGAANPIVASVVANIKEMAKKGESASNHLPSLWQKSRAAENGSGCSP